MKIKTLAASVSSIVAAMNPAMAQEFTGGEIGVEYSAFTQQVLGETLDRVTLDASGEIGFSRSFGVQGDLSYHRFGATDEDAFNFTLHTVYHASEQASLGLFLGNESIAGLDSNFYGIEGGIEHGISSFEVYYAEIEELNFADANIAGIRSEFDIGNDFGVGVDYDTLQADGPGSVSRLTVSGSYHAGRGTNLYAEIGSAHLNNTGIGPDVSETFVGLGMEFTFGANRGSTFGNRSLADLIPGL